MVYVVVAGINLSFLTVKATYEEAVEFATACGRRLLADHEQTESDGTTDCYIVRCQVGGLVSAW